MVLSVPQKTIRLIRDGEKRGGGVWSWGGGGGGGGEREIIYLSLHKTTQIITLKYTEVAQFKTAPTSSYLHCRPEDPALPLPSNGGTASGQLVKQPLDVGRDGTLAGQPGAVGQPHGPRGRLHQAGKDERALDETRHS